MEFARLHKILREHLYVTGYQMCSFCTLFILVAYICLNRKRCVLRSVWYSLHLPQFSFTLFYFSVSFFLSVYSAPTLLCTNWNHIRVVCEREYELNRTPFGCSSFVLCDGSERRNKKAIEEMMSKRTNDEMKKANLEEKLNASTFPSRCLTSRNLSTLYDQKIWKKIFIWH